MVLLPDQVEAQKRTSARQSALIPGRSMLLRSVGVAWEDKATRTGTTAALERLASVLLNTFKGGICI